MTKVIEIDDGKPVPVLFEGSEALASSIADPKLYRKVGFDRRILLPVAIWRGRRELRGPSAQRVDIFRSSPNNGHPPAVPPFGGQRQFQDRRRRAERNAATISRTRAPAFSLSRLES